LGQDVEINTRLGMTGIRYSLRDHIASAGVMLDSTGAVLSHSTYEAYGEANHHGAPPDNISRYTYTSQEAVGELEDKYHYNARMYDAGTGRFLSADTIIPDPTNSQAWNRYMYVEGNPISRNDPTGHCVPGSIPCDLTTMLTQLLVQVTAQINTDNRIEAQKLAEQLGNSDEGTKAYATVRENAAKKGIRFEELGDKDFATLETKLTEGGYKLTALEDGQQRMGLRLPAKGGGSIVVVRENATAGEKAFFGAHELHHASARGLKEAQGKTGRALEYMASKAEEMSDKVAFRFLKKASKAMPHLGIVGDAMSVANPRSQEELLKEGRSVPLLLRPFWIVANFFEISTAAVTNPNSKDGPCGGRPDCT